MHLLMDALPQTRRHMQRSATAHRYLGFLIAYPAALSGGLACFLLVRTVFRYDQALRDFGDGGWKKGGVGWDRSF